MKKIFKITGIILLIFIAILIAIPFVLESKIDAIVQNYADENLNADLSFDDVSLSLISSFPSAEVSVENLKIINRAPFKDATLATAKSLSFEMPLGELFKGAEEPLIINEIIADERRKILTKCQATKLLLVLVSILKTTNSIIAPSLISMKERTPNFTLQKLITTEKASSLGNVLS
jgi:hypothetical protein